MHEGPAAAARLRRAWRAALLRHEADRAAGWETDTARGLAGRFLALLAGAPAAADGAGGAVADMGLRATLAATAMAEVKALERDGLSAAAPGAGAGGAAGVKVYLDEGGERRLIGRAEVPDGCGPVYEVPLFGAASGAVAESFTVGAVARRPGSGGAPVVERAVLAAPGQPVELLPGWKPLAS